jgi:hypothetical protein
MTLRGGYYTVSIVTLTGASLKSVDVLTNPDERTGDYPELADVGYGDYSYELTFSTGAFPLSAGGSKTDSVGVQQSVNPGEIVYSGIPVYQYLYTTTDEIKNYLGTPSFEGGAQAGYYLEYDGISFGFEEYDGTPISVTEISVWKPNLLTVDGATLDKNRNELANLLGAPIFEDWMENEYDAGTFTYQMEYLLWDAPFPLLIIIELPDTDSKATSIRVYPYSA